MIFLAKNSTTTGLQSAVRTQDKEFDKYLIQAAVNGTGAVTATVQILGSVDGVTYMTTPVATITLSGTTSACEGFSGLVRPEFLRANITAISGTGAAVTVALCGRGA